MLLNKPVASVVLDEEPKWSEIFGDAAERLTDPGELFDLLTRLHDDSERRADWVNTRLLAQESFLDEYFCGHSEPAVAAAATAIEALLRGNNGVMGPIVTANAFS